MQKQSKFSLLPIL